MARERVVAFDLARTRFTETLGSPSVGFHLRHTLVFRLVRLNGQYSLSTKSPYSGSGFFLQRFWRENHAQGPAFLFGLLFDLGEFFQILIYSTE